MDISNPAPTRDALRKVESAPTFEVWSLKSSTMRLDWSRAGIVVFTVVGYGHAEFGPPCIRRWSDALRTSERLTSVTDFWDVSGYDSRLRIELTEWLLERRSRLEPLHLLARSPIVRMGAAVANLALGGLIKTYALRANYDAAVNQLSATSKPSRPG